MTETTQNVVTFLPLGGSTHVFLTLAGDWTITGGLQPNVNQATIPWTERSKLPTNLVYVSGTIYFWDDRAGPDDAGSGVLPLHAIGNQWLVDCTAARVGRGPGETVDHVLVYSLAFADHRVAFCKPCGGRLLHGIGNPDPLGTATLRTNSELINACLDAMGVSTSVPSSVNDVDPMRQVEWLGAHAPEEFGRLLQHCAHTYAPYSGGGGSIHRIGVGSLPSLPPDRVVSDVTASSVNRLPTTAVFTSCPEAVARTYNNSADGGSVPQWEFVAQDPANDYEWRALASITALGSTPAAELAKGLPSVADKDRKLFFEQLYKVIRLKSDRFDSLQSPILREVLYPDGKIDQPHLIATVAVRTVDGAWVNRQTRLNAQTIDGVGNLLSFDQRLGTVSGGTERADLEAFFTPLAANAIKPTYTVEDWDASAGRKVFGVYGFTVGLGVGPISESAAKAKLAGFRPEVRIYDVPALRAVYLNDGTNNRSAMESSAQSMAASLLIQQNAARTIEVRGILPCEIDGRINEVRYSPARQLTTIVRDGWSTASLGHRGGHQSRSAAASDEHTVSGDDDPLRQSHRSPEAARHRARAKQAQRGGAFARTPAAASNRVPPAPTGLRSVGVVPTAAIAGQANRYTATSRSGKFDRAATGAFAVTNVGAAGAAADCVVWSSGPLTLNQFYMGHAGPTDNDGKLIVYVNASAAVPTPTAKYRPFQAIDDTLVPGFYSARFE